MAAVKPDPKVESYPVTDPHAPEGERTISAVVARLVQSDALDALAKIEAAVAEKEAAPILGNDLPQPPTDADARLWKIVRAKVMDIVELSRVLQGRGAFAVSDIDKTDEIIAILAEGRACMPGYVLEWCSIDVLGVHTRDYTPHPDAVIVMLWPIWATLPVEFRNLLIMQAKLMKGRR